MLRTLTSFASIVLLLTACGDDTASDPDASTPGADAGPLDGSVRMRDAGVPIDAGPITLADGGACEGWGITPGEPITLEPDGAWTWVDVPEAHCMNGSSTGFGVRRGTVDRVIIYLEGGGVCFDGITCAGVANPDGFGASRFAGSTGYLDGYGIFRRSDSDNPFADWTHVYVPYCTGDTHAGTAVEGFEGREQVGYTNVGLFLARLVPTFPDVETVVLAGSSAGGLGTMANYDQVAQAFGCTPVHMIDDSGPILSQEYLRSCLQTKAIEMFDIPIPADCPQCDPRLGGEMRALWDYLLAKYPDRRFGQLSYTADGTMRNFYGIGLSTRCNFPMTMSATQFEAGLMELRAHLEPNTQTGTFYVDGDAHTFLSSDLGGASAGGATLGTWLGQMVSADAAWDHVGP